MKTKKYDIIIVGGSCAGASAGHILAKAGKRVAIIDKAIFPRKKLCGGMITEKTINILKVVYGDILFENIIDSKFNTYGIYYSSAGKICKYTSTSRQLYFVDRTIFDNYFLRRAETMGCSVIMGQKVVNVSTNNVVLESGEQIVADYILGADGSDSIIHKTMFHEKSDKKAAIALEVDVSYDDLNCFEYNEDIYPRIYFGVVKDGYGWLFPKKELVTIGLGGLVGSNKNIRELFMLFLNNFVKRNHDNIGSRITGFPIPFNNLIKKPARNNFFLLGDAAGLIEPVTGEGIFFAILSGKLAAEALLTSSDCAAYYNSSIKKLIHRLLKEAYFAKYFLFHPLYLNHAMYKMKNNAKYCKYYFDLLSGEIDYWGYAMKVLRDRNKYKSE